MTVIKREGAPAPPSKSDTGKVSSWRVEISFALQYNFVPLEILILKDASPLNMKDICLKLKCIASI